MAYGVIHHFPGGTRENHEASVAAVHPGPDTLPPGQVMDIAGAVERGRTIVAVHESQENWEGFRDNVLAPRLQAGIDGGFPTPPRETTIELYAVKP
jgi:hypothetical protein